MPYLRGTRYAIRTMRRVVASLIPAGAIQNTTGGYVLNTSGGYITA